MPSSTYIKGRIQLLNETTGVPMGEVEIISNSSEIFYSNSDPTLKPIGNIPKGTTFDKESIARIFDGILYEDVDPYISDYTSSNGDITKINNDITIVKPIGSQVSQFTLGAIFNFGSKPKNTCTVYTSSAGGDTKSQTILVERLNGELSKSISFTIEAFTSNTDIKISDGPVIHYKFVSPVFIGWAKPELISSKGELDKSITEDYFHELITHKSKLIATKYVDKSPQNAMIVPGINYDNREQLNPCILIPQSWGRLTSIVDMNGNNIYNSYASKVGLDIEVTTGHIEHYIGYVSRQTFNNDEDFIRSIVYNTDVNEIHVNMDNYAALGIPLTVGYSVMYNTPIDERCNCKTYGDLLKTLYPYPGLLTYVEDINTTFRFENGHWSPFGSKTHIVNDSSELIETLGSWDDMAIDASTGKLYKKRYNNVWELWWEITVDIDAKTIKLDRTEMEENK